MGCTDTTNAAASTSITIATGVDMSKLLEELVREFESNRPPKEAVTVAQFVQELDAVSVTYARAYLDKKLSKEGWESTIFRGIKYYWKP